MQFSIFISHSPPWYCRIMVSFARIGATTELGKKLLILNRLGEFFDRTAHARDAILQAEHDFLFLQPDHGPAMTPQKGIVRPVLCALVRAGMSFPVVALDCDRALPAPYREIKTIPFSVSLSAAGNVVLGNRLNAGSRECIPDHFFGRRNTIQLQNIFLLTTQEPWSSIGI